MSNLLFGQASFDNICTGSKNESILPNDKITCVFNYCKLNSRTYENDIKGILDSALVFINNYKLTHRIGEFYYYYGNMYLDVETYDSAEFYFKKSLDYITENNTQLLYQLNLKLGVSYRRQNEFEKSLDLFNTAMEYAVKANNKSKIAATYSELGILFTEQENYSEAISNFQKSINDYKEKNDTLSVAKVYTNIASLYRRTGNNPLAMDYLQKSHAIYSKLNNVEGLAAAYNNMGQVYQSMTNYRKAEEHLLKAIAIYETISSQLNTALVYNSLGNVKRSYKKSDESLACLNKALEIFKKLNDEVGQVTVLKDIGLLYLEMDEHQTAIEYFMQSKNISQKMNKPVLKLELYELLSEAYAKKSSFYNAYSYRMKYEKLYHETLILQKNKEHILLRSKLQMKEEEVEAFKVQNRIEVNKLVNEIRIYRISFLVILIVFIVILVVTYIKNSRIRKHKAHVISTKTNSMLQYAENEQLLRSKIETLNKDKEKFFAIATKNIVEPVESLRSLVSNISNSNDQDIDTKLLQFLHDNKDSITMAYNLIENVLYWSRYQEGKVDYEPDYCNLEELIEKVVGYQNIRAEAKNIQLMVSGFEGFEGYFDKKMVEVALRNLLENAIKFSTWGGTVEVRGKRIEDKLQISIFDKGVGMTKEQVAKLANYEKIEAAMGTHGERGGGIGFILAHEFIKRNFGTLNIASSIAEGTIVQVVLPSSSKKLTS